MNKTLITIAATAALVFSINASAGGVYIASQITNTNIDAKVNVGNLITFDADLDTATGANLSIGYRANHYVSVEGTFAEFGGSTTQLAEGIELAAGGYSRDVAFVFDPTITKLGSMPLKGIVRFGGGYSKIKTNAGNFSGTSGLYGIGIGLGLSKNLDLFLDYRVRTVNSTVNYEGININVDADIKTCGLGLKYTF